MVYIYIEEGVKGVRPCVCQLKDRGKDNYNEGFLRITHYILCVFFVFVSVNAH